MPLQMLLYLALCFHQKAHAPFVSGNAGRNAEAEGGRVPGRIQQTWPPTQFVDPLPAPGKVVTLFFSSVFKYAANFGTSRHHGLPPIQSLGAEFATMIDAHESHRLGIIGLNRHICR